LAEGIFSYTHHVSSFSLPFYPAHEIGSSHLFLIRLLQEFFSSTLLPQSSLASISCHFLHVHLLYSPSHMEERFLELLFAVNSFSSNSLTNPSPRSNFFCNTPFLFSSYGVKVKANNDFSFLPSLFSNSLLPAPNEVVNKKRSYSF